MLCISLTLLVTESKAFGLSYFYFLLFVFQFDFHLIYFVIWFKSSTEGRGELPKAGMKRSKIALTKMC